ncbi:MAG: N-acetylmuramoyl-L-alanine amidase [Betaproteobacteria bacterium]
MEKPRITNVWATEHADPICRRMTSRLVIEATLPVPHRVRAPSPGQVRVDLLGCDLAMAPDTLGVNDGLLVEVTVAEDRPHPSVIARLEHACSWSATESAGVPARLVIDFDRSAIRAIFEGRVVGVDPGHGGSDTGERGPVNLLEKNIALDIARLLATRLTLAGAAVVMTRTSDEEVPMAKRLSQAREARADVFVSVHTFGSRDRSVAGSRALYVPDSRSERLAKHIESSLSAKLPVVSRGVARYPGRLPADLGMACVFVEVATITNWVEEGWFRSATFKERAASAIMTGLKRYFAEQPRESHPASRRPGKAKGVESETNGASVNGKGVTGGQKDELTEIPVTAHVIPIRTHIVGEHERIADVVCRYVRGIARPGDVIAVAESVVAITQGRAVLPGAVRPGALARVLCKLPGKDGSLATPPAMELAIREAGVGRVLLGTAAAGVGRLLGRRGDFFRVAGRSLAQIDDIAGTMPPYDKHVILGPAHPDEVAREIRASTGVDAAIVDVNDIGCVDVLGSTLPGESDWLMRALAHNPFGNDDQQTPIVVVKPRSP